MATDPKDLAMRALNVAIDAVGSASGLASSIGLSVNAAFMWQRRGNIPAEHAMAIEELTRAIHKRDPSKPIVFCEQLAPKAKWHVLRKRKFASIGV